MKILVRILIVVFLLVAVAVFIAYLDGSSLPLAHSVSVTGTVAASPDKVFARITDVAHGNTWRPAVKSVKVLPPDDGRDHWIEDLGHGQTMTFLAVTTAAPSRREVLLDVPGAAYGGAWLYELAPGSTPNTTTLTITETGFIHPPLYRFMMAHIFGPTRNLDQYLHDIQAAMAKG